MSDPFLSQIKIFAFDFAPRGWAQCNGQLLPINQNQALFALIGTMYGGNGQTTFALPDLRSRIPVHHGAGTSQGQRAGEETHTVTVNELPAHAHAANGRSELGTATSPVGNAWAGAPSQLYAAAPNTTMAPNNIATVGGGQPHDNMTPYLVLNVCIALVGVFPSRD
ncbi:MAG: phage tail protein [Micromonosporaceae bacterium]